MRIHLLAVLLVQSSACSSSKSAEIKVTELGIAINAPDSWKPDKRGDGVTLGSGTDGVVLRASDTKLASIDDARKALMSGAKIKKEEKLASGGYLFIYDVEFPSSDKPMLLPYVTVLLPTAKGSISCEVQLQPSQDPTPYADVCKSMRSL